MPDPNDDVCHVNEQGELICSHEAAIKGPQAEAIQAAIQNNVSGISPERLDLIVRLANEVLLSPLDDACIGKRSGDAVESIHLVLETEPPVMLLYRYFALPGNILATFYKRRGNFIALHNAIEHWSTLKPGC